MDKLTMIWNEVVNMLDLDLNTIQLKNWIKPLTPIAMDKQKMILDCKSTFIRTMVQKKYQDKIDEYLSYICETSMTTQLIDPSQSEYFTLLSRTKEREEGVATEIFSKNSPSDPHENQFFNQEGQTRERDTGEGLGSEKRQVEITRGQEGIRQEQMSSIFQEKNDARENNSSPLKNQTTSGSAPLKNQATSGSASLKNQATSGSASLKNQTARNSAPDADALAEKIKEKKRLREKQQSENGYMTLNPKYTLESFVQGKSNDFAYAAAQAVVTHPGTIYNPLFIYGGSGLGKTHLMQGIAHAVLKKDPTKKVLYITSENFMNEMIAMIENGTHREKENFRRKYRSIDVLLIDDIQFIAGKKATMEEIFHTFNHLKEANRQIVLSSDKPPQELKNLEERLVTRFEGGMTVDIQKPDFETRVAILKHKMKGESLELPDYVLSFIAENVTSNIRELEGVLLRVIAYYVYKKVDPLTTSKDRNMALAREAMKIEEEREREIAIEDIIYRVTEYYNLESNALTGKSRQNSVALPRQIAMYLARRLTNESLVSIGRSFSRDHTTVMHGLDKIESLIQKDEKVKNDVSLLTDQLKHG